MHLLTRIIPFAIIPGICENLISQQTIIIFTFHKKTEKLSWKTILFPWESTLATELSTFLGHLAARGLFLRSRQTAPRKCYLPWDCANPRHRLPSKQQLPELSAPAWICFETAQDKTDQGRSGETSGICQRICDAAQESAKPGCEDFLRG